MKFYERQNTCDFFHSCIFSDFLIFCFLIDLIFRNTLSVFTDLLAVVCWIIAFIVSVGLADYTVKRIKK